VALLQGEDEFALAVDVEDRRRLRDHAGGEALNV
jgi:hypothetical protein